MAKDREKKTNALRELDAAGLPYRPRFFDTPEALSGVEVAQRLGLDADRVFKTLVTLGKSGQHLVFMIPVACELDLKKAAAAAGEKAVAMVKSKELLPLTGYVHGGCSPIGMKKKYPTLIDETAQLFDRIYVSAGMRGHQIIVAPDALAKFVEAKYADLTK